jgi:hypothetical protein
MRRTWGLNIKENDLPLLRSKAIHDTQYSTKLETLPDTSEDIFDLDDLDGCEGETEQELFDALDTLDCFAPPEGWSKIVTDDPPKPLSKKVTRRRRRSNDRDAQAIKTIQESELPAASTHYPSLVGTLHPLITTQPIGPSLAPPMPSRSIWGQISFNAL